MKNYTFCALSAIFGLCLVLVNPIHGYTQSSSNINVSKTVNTSVVPETLGPNVNTNYFEAGPKPSLDGKRLYYSRLGHPKNKGGEKDQDIWYNVFIDSTQSWSESINIGAPLNNKGPNFVFEVGWNGDSLLLGNVYGKNGKMSSGLSVAVRAGNTWATPKEVYLKNNYNFSSKGTFDLSHDRKALLISEEKVDSRGKRDLYVALRKPGPRPYAESEAINLGAVINTSGDEASPFLSDDGRTLFFSSDGHKGYGMSDLFMSKRLDDTWVNWSNPENLGPQINTPFDDGQFVFTPHAKYAYYSRGINATRSDIYRVAMANLFDTEKDLDGDKIGQVFIVENVFNDSKAEVKDESVYNLEKVVQYLQRNKNMTVQVSTHSNIQKSRKESAELSNKRIAAIQDYLTTKGIEVGRLRFQAYGQDVVENTPDADMKKQIASQVEFSFVNYGR